MLMHFAKNASYLLDVACGRGGDISKWITANITRVKGIDLSEDEVREARRRFAEHPHTAWTKCDFEVCGTFGAEAYRDGIEYDIVTCNFALHYFYESERTLDRFLSNVAANLKEGGTFFGVVPDGDRVAAALAGSSPNAFVRLRYLDDSPAPQPFGTCYVCSIGDTVTESIDDSEGSHEFLATPDVLVEAAARHGLFPIVEYGSTLKNLFEPQDADKVFKHFDPHYERTAHPDLDGASRLFAAFAFIKRG
jgi:mRNA (guanine-N7-)-methyltransferase